MADPEAKGAEFEKKADKKLSGWAVFGTKYDDAAELLEKAANSYKLAKSCMLLCSGLICGSFLSFLGFRTFSCIFLRVSLMFFFLFPIVVNLISIIT
jgi:hypothetical protein